MTDASIKRMRGIVYPVLDVEAKPAEVTAASATVTEPAARCRWRPSTRGKLHRPGWQRARVDPGPLIPLGAPNPS